jgi:mannose/fructose-specific phosphotransferase system component IIA
MIGVIVAGHGNLASEVISTAEKTLGKQEHLEAVSMKVGEGEGALRTKLDAVLRMSKVDDVIVLADIFGSSFSKECVYLAKNRGHVAVVTGVNLPMVLKVLTYRQRVDLSELVSLACAGGKEGIRDACGLVEAGFKE